MTLKEPSVFKEENERGDFKDIRGNNIAALAQALNSIYRYVQ